MTLNEVEMVTAIEIARQRCCLYHADCLGWMKRNGISVQRLGEDGVQWLLEQGVLRPYDEEFYVIDRGRCIEVYIEVAPEKMRGDPRFASDQAMALLKYGQLAERIEDGLRLFMFFREIANAARCWDMAGKCSADPTHCGLPAYAEYESIPPTFKRDVW